MARIKKLAAWLDRRYPQAAASLLEGLHRSASPSTGSTSRRRCTAVWRPIESPHAGIRIQTRRVTHWQNGKMVLRWMASALLLSNLPVSCLESPPAKAGLLLRTEKRFKRIMRHRDLWALEAILNPAATAYQKAAQ